MCCGTVVDKHQVRDPHLRVPNSTAPYRWLLWAGEVGDHVASGPPAVLNRAQLYPATLAPLVHGHLSGLHAVDRHLLLPHGVDGKKL